MDATIQRVKDSFIVHLPTSIVKNLKIKESETVQVFEEYGRIIIQKTDTAALVSDIVRPTINELFEEYEGEYEPTAIDWGAPVGKEIW